MERVQLFLLAMALVIGVGGLLLFKKGPIYRKYKKEIFTMTLQTDILIIKKFSISNIKNLLEQVVGRNEDEKDDLKAYLKFLENISEWEDISDIKISLLDHKIPDWVKFYPVKHGIVTLGVWFLVFGCIFSIMSFLSPLFFLIIHK